MVPPRRFVIITTIPGGTGGLERNHGSNPIRLPATATAGIVRRRRRILLLVPADCHQFGVIVHGDGGRVRVEEDLPQNSRQPIPRQDFRLIRSILPKNPFHACS